MSDLVERLRTSDPFNNRGPEYMPIMIPPSALRLEAATEIERLRAELSRLSALVAEWQKAAEPFAAAMPLIGSAPDDAPFLTSRYQEPIGPTVGDFRRLSQLKDTTNADK